MAFTPPIFNVQADLWFGTNTPNAGLPDFENQECQFYITSRGQWPIDGANAELWSPPIYLRIPVASEFNWREFQICEVPPGTGRYYRVRWKDRVHLGFPNEYLLGVLHQCDGDGVWLLRDVGAGTTPMTHTGSILTIMNVGTVMSSTGQNIP